MFLNQKYAQKASKNRKQWESGVRTGVASKEYAKQGSKRHGVQRMRMLACQRVYGRMRQIWGWGKLEKEEGGCFLTRNIFYYYLLLCMYIWLGKNFVIEKKHFKISYNQVHQWLDSIYIH